MEGSTLTLKEALSVLEISNLGDIQEKDLKKIAKRAKSKWHPDKITHTNPPEEIVKRYNERFQSIDAAIQLVLDYLQGLYQESPSYSEGYGAETDSSSASEDIGNAAAYHSFLKTHWQDIRAKMEKTDSEEHVVFEGFSYKETLLQDLEDNIPVLSILSYFSGALALLCLSLAFSVGAMAFPPLIYVSQLMIFLIIIYGLICLLLALPLARFWLPGVVGDFVFKVVNLGLDFYNSLADSGFSQNIFFAIFFGIPTILGKIFQTVVMYPLYHIVGSLLKNAKFGMVKEEVTYYGDLAEWYIDQLIQTPTEELTVRNIADLAHFCKQYK